MTSGTDLEEGRFVVVVEEVLNMRKCGKCGIETEYPKEFEGQVLYGDCYVKKSRECYGGCGCECGWR